MNTEKLNRYPGSKPFTIDYQEVFFGRDEDINGLGKYVQTERITVLYAKSGLGKSSLLNAGVLPRLERDYGFLSIPIRFQAHTKDKKVLPLQILFEGVREKAQEESFLDKIDPDDSSLWKYAKAIQLKQAPSDYLLFVFDQFEELFTYPEGIEEVGKAIEGLLNNDIPRSFRRRIRQMAINNPDQLSAEEWEQVETPLRVKVLCAIRSDRMHLLDRLAGSLPQILRNNYELKALSKLQAEQAIVGPTLKYGEFLSQRFNYSKEALEKILGYLTKENKKLVESFQLQILCQYVEESLVIKKGKKLIESPDLGDLELIYQNYYDFHIEKLGDSETQSKARILLEEGLIYEEEERRISLDEGLIYTQYGVESELLRTLVNTHLIRSEPNRTGDGFTYELSHDTLVGPILNSKEKRKEREEINLKRIKLKKRRNRLIAWTSSVITIIILLSSSLYYVVSLLNRIKSEQRERVRMLINDKFQREVYELNFEEATRTVQYALDIGEAKELTIKAVSELIYFYNSAGKNNIAAKLLENTYKLINEEFVGVKDTLEFISKSWPLITSQSYLDTLRRKYFPEFIVLDGGEFFMGSDSTEKRRRMSEEVMHPVILPDFKIGKFEISFWQFEVFRVAVDSPKVMEPPWGINGDHPAIRVTWFDAVSYVNWLSKKEGLKPVYSINGPDVKWDSTANGYRLPTEAEWEYAAGGGKKGRNDQGKRKYQYAGSNDMEVIAWYSKNSNKQTHPIGTKAPNLQGIYDMSGNVWEWCWDGYDKNYYTYCLENNIVFHPSGIPNNKAKVYRGGSCDVLFKCRTAVRVGKSPHLIDDDVGFRIAQNLK